MFEHLGVLGAVLGPPDLGDPDERAELLLPHQRVLALVQDLVVVRLGEGGEIMEREEGKEEDEERENEKKEEEEEEY